MENTGEESIALMNFNHVPPINNQSDDLLLIQSYCVDTTTEDDDDDDEATYKRKDFFKSIENGDYKNVLRALNEGIHPNTVHYEFRINGCHLACFHGHVKILELLIQKGTEFDVVDKYCRTPLDMALWNGHIQCVEFILVALKKRESVVNNDFGTKKKYITKEIDNIWFGTSPLHIASGRLHYDCLQVLLDSNFESSLTDINGRTILDVCGEAYDSTSLIAVEDGKQRFQNIVEILLKNSCGTTKLKDCTPLHRAIYLKSKIGVNSLLQFDNYYNSLDKQGETLLHLAVQKKKKRILLSLLNKICVIDREFIDRKNSKGFTALHVAIVNRWKKGLLLLIKFGANILATSNCGNTPLHLAALSSSPEILQDILDELPQKDKNINIKNNDNETPILKAISAGNDVHVNILLKENASLNIYAKNNYTAIHTAVASNHKDILKDLLVADSYLQKSERTINQYTSDQFNMNALHLAAYENKLECFRLLIEFGMDLKSRTIISSYTPLHLAAMRGHIKIIELILQHDINLMEERDWQNWKPFYRAAYKGDRDSVTLFLKNGADLADTLIHRGKTRTVMEILINNMPRSHQYLEQLFDSLISKNECEIDDDCCEITIDYMVLIPAYETEKEKGYDHQMDVIAALLQTKRRFKHLKLLLHPYIESFLYLKWMKGIRYFYLSLLLMFVLYALSLTWTVMCIYSDSCEAFLPKKVLSFFLTYMIVQELFLFLVLLSRNKLYHYIHRITSLLNWISISFSIAVLVLDTLLPGSNWQKYTTAIAVLIVWLEITTLLSNFPECGYTFQMYSTVLHRALKVMAIFGIQMIIGFSLAFWILFQGQPAFTGIIDSLVRTIVMTSEFDYVALFEDFENSNHRTFVQLIFVMFIFFVPIVMMNLIMALIISDTNDLKTEGKIKRLTSQVVMIDILECVIYFILRRRLARLERIIKIYPGKPSWEAISLVSNNIEEALFRCVKPNKKPKSR